MNLIPLFYDFLLESIRYKSLFGHIFQEKTRSCFHLKLVTTFLRKNKYIVRQFIALLQALPNLRVPKFKTFVKKKKKILQFNGFYRVSFQQ